MPDKRTTSCKRCLLSFITPNLGIIHLTSIPVSLDLTASLLMISANSVNSTYGDISLAINKILFFDISFWLYGKSGFSLGVQKYGNFPQKTCGYQHLS